MSNKRRKETQATGNEKYYTEGYVKEIFVRTASCGRKGKDQILLRIEGANMFKLDDAQERKSGLLIVEGNEEGLPRREKLCLKARVVCSKHRFKGVTRDLQLFLSLKQSRVRARFVIDKSIQRISSVVAL